MTISSVAGKSADAFRTISEVAEALKLPQHVLRFWETRFAQIKPMKRAGGRRFYRPEDVELLGAIRQLLYGEGYTIKGVQRILKEQGPRAVAALARGQASGDVGDLPPYVEGLAEDGAGIAGEAEPGRMPEAGETDVAPGAEAFAMPSPFSWSSAATSPADMPATDARQAALASLGHVLDDLDACRRLLDEAGR